MSDDDGSFLIINNNGQGGTVEKVTIGKCSLCGGNVMQYQLWAGSCMPLAECADCGAVEDTGLPIIKMKRP